MTIPFIDVLLNRFTMYRLVLYYVAVLLAAAFAAGFAHVIGAEPTALAFSAAVVLATCWVANRLFCLAFRVPANAESIFITALILILIMPPVTADNLAGTGGLVIASLAAVASKFVLAHKRRHLFNPVAVGAVAAMFLANSPATWWVGGNLPLMALVLAGGFLVVRKVQRFDMVGAFVLANLAGTIVTTPPDMWSMALNEAVLHSPLFFAGAAMLTEPLTAPPGRLTRVIFGAMVGVLASPNIHVGDFYLTPEIALLIGNAFAFAVSPKRRFRLTLLRVERMASGCYDFVFRPDARMDFEAGQYLDWTIDARHGDDRGNRRPFTIASSPQEREVRLGVKFYPKPSAFKVALRDMKPGDTIFASHLAGSFTLPSDPDEKLAFIAGGIGVTPFRSMIGDLIMRGDARDLVMLYGNNTMAEIAYAHVFDRAERELGLRTVYAVAEDAPPGTNIHRGFIDAELIRREVPDWLDRTFYISGPRSMVVRFAKVLSELGVARSRIRVDFFPGFA